MKNKSAVRQYFYFTRTERIGIAALSLLCTVSIVLPRAYRRWFPPQAAETVAPVPRLARLTTQEPLAEQEEAAEKTSSPAALFSFNPNTASESELQALGLPARTIKSILNYRSKGGKFRTPDDLGRIYTLSESDFRRLLPWVELSHAAHQATPAALESASSPVLQPFDPNSVTEEQLLQMGIAPRLAKGWLNYLAKGGKFRQPDDLRKLYGLSEAEANRLLPFVVIPPTTPTAGTTSRPVKPVNINSTAADDWTQLPGIGAGWARKIMAYRDKLGGFVHPRQVAETRSLPDSVYQRILPYLTVTPSPLTRVQLNTATWEELSAHPYIEARQARWIVAFREQHGPYRQPQDLLRIPELKPDWLEKLKPYLAF